MAAPFFHVGGSKYISIATLNIHGVRNKLESQFMTQWIHNYDIIFLCETATNVVFSVPGYHVITRKTAVPNRGGVVILVKNYLYEYITAVDITVNDQIWFAFSFMPSVL